MKDVKVHCPLLTDFIGLMFRNSLLCDHKVFLYNSYFLDKHCQCFMNIVRQVIIVLLPASSQTGAVASGKTALTFL